MAHRLPLVAPHRREHTYCAYCPKLCRAACPVSNAEARETVTPWGKMSLLNAADRALVPLDGPHAAPLWACTGCQGCRSSCLHQNDVARSLASGRAEAFARGAAPPGAVRLAARFGARESLLARRLGRLGAAAAAAPRRKGLAYVPGCALGLERPRLAERIASRLGNGRTTAVDVVADRCCGLPLYYAGDREGFLRAARAMRQRLSKAEVVVSSDPGCTYALRVLYAEVAREPLSCVRHLTEQLALEEPGTVVAPTVAPARPVLYHDACLLGRGLGLYEPPRALLERRTGQAPIELALTRNRAVCSGAGGALEWTAPSTARRIAASLVGDAAAAAPEGTVLVTGCPGAARAMRRSAPAGMRVVDLAEVLVSDVGPG